MNLTTFLQSMIKADALPPAYEFSDKLGKYRNIVTGKFVSFKQVLSLLDANAAPQIKTLENLSIAVSEHKLSVSAWYMAMQQQLGRLTVQNAALAAGGFDKLKATDFARLDKSLRDDFKRLNNFGRDLDAGKLSQAQIINRIQMYAGTARKQYYASQPRPKTKKGEVVLERRVLGAAEHCSWCTYLAGLGWQPYGILPLPGASNPDCKDDQCLSHCQCRIERKVVSRKESAALLGMIKTFFVPHYSYRNILIKGGVGSGNYGHKGRPGEQGGSLAGHHHPLTPSAPDDYNAPEVFTPTQGSRHNPLMELYAGDKPRFDDYGNVDFSLGRASGLKDLIAKQISADTGTDYAEANQFVRNWADSSNDHSLQALGLQDVAAQEFGTSLSSWQTERLRRVLSDREDRISALLTEGYAANHSHAEAFAHVANNMRAATLYPFEQNALRRTMQDITDGKIKLTSASTARQLLTQAEGEAKDKIVKAVHSMHASTQSLFEQAGITEAHAFRVSILPEADVANWHTGDRIKVKGNALSSWTVTEDSAQDLYHVVPHASNPDVHVVIETVIPVSRIVATPMTGVGCLREWEIVVHGSDGPDEAQIVSMRSATNAKYKSAIIKGGAGSGNYHHAGRPGEQGGSAEGDGVNAQDAASVSAQTTVHDPSQSMTDRSMPNLPHPGRVWNGVSEEAESTLSKLETGAIGEAVTMDVMAQIHGVPFGTVNVNVNNAPFDVSGDHMAVEVKTGLATNGKSAQQWRATIGQPGKEEAALLAKMTSDEKREHNAWKYQAILNRKHNLLAKMSQEAGSPIKPVTVGLILSGDGSKADVYAHDGFHLRIPWAKGATEENYLGTYDVKNKVMHWKDKPIKTLEVSEETLSNLLTGNDAPSALSASPISTMVSGSRRRWAARWAT